ncbi:MAG: GNAT family N-acetyltransferase [Spirochaetes bacterium]|nr:GNAT family N-acetyltransferase [Spirochaetota bacterium]
MIELPEDEVRYLRSIRPERLDRAWEKGWRHFGPVFFRETKQPNRGRDCLVLPLRIDLGAFRPGRTQRKLWAKSGFLKAEFSLAAFGDEKEALFRKHVTRFTHHLPESLEHFLGDEPQRVPAPIHECRLTDGETLVAVGFFDRGERAASAIYTMWDPAYHEASPGILMVLHEIEWAKAQGLSWLYTGYYFREPSDYSYKASFHATQYYDWKGNWKPLDETP